jgi:hypothetical protein
LNDDCREPVWEFAGRIQIIGNLRAVQILLGHAKIESTVRYLGADIEDALALAEGTEVQIFAGAHLVSAGSLRGVSHEVPTCRGQPG